jgi:hypothetical protein
MKVLASFRRMVSAKENATKVPSSKAVQPRHRVLEAVVAFAAKFKK